MERRSSGEESWLEINRETHFNLNNFVVEVY